MTWLQVGKAEPWTNGRTGDCDGSIFPGPPVSGAACSHPPHVTPISDSDSHIRSDKHEREAKEDLAGAAAFYP